jgi:hypothetical protein
MSYASALKAAGATVHQFSQFGDYSGQWFAKVTHNGETGWVQGWYGSCSHCDSFEGEFGDLFSEESEEDYHKRLADFGQGYLTVFPASHYLPGLDEEAEWDYNAESAANWIRKIEGVI